MDTSTPTSINDFMLRKRSASQPSPNPSRFAAAALSRPPPPTSASDERNQVLPRQPVPRFPWADSQDSRSPKSSADDTGPHPYAIGRSPLLSALMSPPPSSSDQVEFGIAVGGIELSDSESPVQAKIFPSSQSRAVSKEAVYSQKGRHEPTWRRRQRENSESAEGGGGSVGGSGSISSQFSGQGGYSSVPTSVESHSVEDMRGLAASPHEFRSPSGFRTLTKMIAAKTLVEGKGPNVQEVLRSVPISSAFEPSTVTNPPRPSQPDFNPSPPPNANSGAGRPLVYSASRLHDRSGWESDEETSTRAPTKKELKQQEKLEKEAVKKWKKLRKEVANRPRVDFGDISLPPAEALLHDVPRFSLRTVTKEVQAAGEKALIDPIPIAEMEEEEELAPNQNWAPEIHDADIAQEAHDPLLAGSKASKVKALFRFGAKRNFNKHTETPSPSTQSPHTIKKSPRRLHKTRPALLVISCPDADSGPVLPPPQAPAPFAFSSAIRRGAGSDVTKVRLNNEFESEFGYLGRKTELFNAVDAAEVQRKAHRRTSSLPSSFHPIPQQPSSPTLTMGLGMLAPLPPTSSHPIIANLPIERRLRSKRANRRNNGDARAAVVTGWLSELDIQPESGSETNHIALQTLEQEQGASVKLDSADSIILAPPRLLYDPVRPSPSSSQIPHSPDHAVVHHRRRYGVLPSALDLPSTPPLFSPDPYDGIDATEEQSPDPPTSQLVLSKSTQLLNQLLSQQNQGSTHDSYLSLSDFPDPPHVVTTRQGSTESSTDTDSIAGSVSPDALVFDLGVPQQHPCSKSYSSGFTLSSAKDDELFFHLPDRHDESYPRRKEQQGMLQSLTRDQSTRTSERSAQRLDLVRRTPSLVKTSSLSRGSSGRRHPTPDSTALLKEDSKSSISNLSVKIVTMDGPGAATGLRHRLQQEVARRV